MLQCEMPDDEAAQLRHGIALHGAQHAAEIRVSEVPYRQACRRQLQRRQREDVAACTIPRGNRRPDAHAP